MEAITEGKAIIKATKPKVVSKQMEVFYNPVMELNRSLSVLLLKSIPESKLRIALPLAASGIRGIRLIKELPASKINEISFNDYGIKFKQNLEKNLKLNKIKLNKKIKVHNQDANLFLLESSGFDYIDIDPFGPPILFLDSAVKRIARNGILAVTATDTAALCGTYADACKRKYWAVPLRNDIMHEFGLRILIRRVQLIGAQYEKALIPILSYSREHYMRAFFRCIKGKKEVDKIVAQHHLYESAGPVWTGQLEDNAVLTKLFSNADDDKMKKFLKTLKDESKISTIGFYDIHSLCKKLKVAIPKKPCLIKKIRKHGFKASETHFSPVGIRSDIAEKELIKILKNP